MPRFLYVYHADAPIDMSPEDAAVAIEQWGKWMESLGPALVEAASIDQACDMAKGNPMVEGGGAVEVAEIMPMPM